MMAAGACVAARLPMFSRATFWRGVLGRASSLVPGGYASKFSALRAAGVLWRNGVSF